MVMSKVFVEDTEMQDIANAIREKNGTETKYLPSEMGGAIREISESNQLTLYGQTLYRMFQRVAFPEGTELTIYMPNLRGNEIVSNTMSYTFNQTTGLKKAKIKCDEGLDIDLMQECFNNSSVEIVDLSEFPRHLKNINNCFGSCKKLKEIIGELSTVGNLYAFQNCNSLEEIRFKKECLITGTSFQHSSLLSDESVQSIIDGLADLTGQTKMNLVFHSNVTLKLTDEQLTQIDTKNWNLV